MCDITLACVWHYVFIWTDQKGLLACKKRDNANEWMISRISIRRALHTNKSCHTWNWVRWHINLCVWLRM